MPSANFYLNRPFERGSGKKHPTKILNPNETMVFLYVCFPGRNIVKVSTGEKIKAKDWDFKKKVMKSTAAGSLAFNSRITFIKSEVLQAISKATTENPQMTLPMIRQIVEDVLNGKKISIEKNNFFEYYEMFLAEIKMLHRHGTYKKFKSFKNILIEYLEYRNIPLRDFYFESVDHEFDLFFRDHLITVRQNVNNTISKAYESLSTVMQWGLKKKFHRNSTFEDFNVFKRDKGDVIYLELDEVKAIESLNLTGTEAVVRDIFLFALFSGGQRIGDVLNAKVKDFQTREDGTLLAWDLFQIKNKRTVKNTLPLLDRAILAISKYYSLRKDISDKVFPHLSEQHINRSLKEICQKARISQHTRCLRYRGVTPVEIEGPKYEFISFHSARRSFVSIARKLGMGSDLIILYTGHATEKVMRSHYLGISEEFKREALFKVWQPDQAK